MKKVKCAVVGTGIFGEIHVHTYSTYEKAELLMICDLNEKRATEISKKYGVRYTTDYNEIAENDEIEAVSVATPDFAHKDIVVKMLENGKHVLVEKPISDNMKDAEKMVKKAKKALKTGGWLVVYSPHIEQVKAVKEEMIKNGFKDIETIEVIKRKWKVDNFTHPVPSGILHTGFMTFARKI